MICMVTVLFFGPLAEIIGSNSLQVQDAVDTVTLQQLLSGRFPLLAQRKYAVAVNQTIVHQNTALQPGSVVAFLPPFSGG